MYKFPNIEHATNMAAFELSRGDKYLKNLTPDRQHANAYPSERVISKYNN